MQESSILQCIVKSLIQKPQLTKRQQHRYNKLIFIYYCLYPRELTLKQVPEPLSFMTFEKSADLSLWLKENHTIQSELWVKIYKIKSGIQSVSWNDVVLECLCWGWIDGVKKSIDEQAYFQRITPRKSRSAWSKKNTEHVECLTQAGRMQTSGLAHVEAAKQDGRWNSAYVASEMVVPKDFIAALENQPKAKAFYTTLNKTNRYVIAYGLTSAKKAQTRQRRFTKYMTMLALHEKPK